jgi:hypothetical protein
MKKLLPLAIAAISCVAVSNSFAQDHVFAGEGSKEKPYYIDRCGDISKPGYYEFVKDVDHLPKPHAHESSCLKILDDGKNEIEVNFAGFQILQEDVLSKAADPSLCVEEHGTVAIEILQKGEAGRGVIRIYDSEFDSESNKANIEGGCVGIHAQALDFFAPKAADTDLKRILIERIRTQEVAHAALIQAPYLRLSEAELKESYVGVTNGYTDPDNLEDFPTIIDNEYEDLKISDSEQYGFWQAATNFESGNPSTLTDSTIDGSGETGVRIEDNGVELLRVVASDSGDYGFHILPFPVGGTVCNDFDDVSLRSVTGNEAGEDSLLIAPDVCAVVVADSTFLQAGGYDINGDTDALKASNTTCQNNTFINNSASNPSDDCLLGNAK